ncbi:MAG: copper amine oxidase N-terminal domain-containing protein [Syntrophothermus sp.]|uniref:copper amine oxidase N-terminal domain-containing protein n=1 Tax=Syntrophothermus sp. TaxID=2736299 RepID=UPI00257A27F8|nr:copper amine oxidase N-terminal domain-containing protein [Syntrophothermus sp.]NSW82086.1 copper amine oxidase N-terminal domain-containing protein [Syntrophothermus sp.]
MSSTTFDKLAVFIAGFLVGALLFGSAQVWAGNSIKLYVDGEEVKCDVPPQFTGGRVLVPIRAVAEAFQATVKWDSAKQAVIITSKDYEPIPCPEFSGAVTVTKPGAYLNFKVDRNQLPVSMKGFTKIATPAVDQPTEKMFGYWIREQQNFPLEDYDDLNGVNEAAPSRYYLIILFDQDKRPLGYQLVDMNK